MLLFALENAIVGIPFVGPLILTTSVFLGLHYLGRFKRATVKLLGNVTFVLVLADLPFAWLANNGAEGSTLFVYLSIIVAAMSVFNGRLRVFWTTITFGHFAAMMGVQYFYSNLIAPYPSPEIQRVDIAFSFLIVAAALMGYVSINMYNLDERRKAGDALLLNILPDVVAEKLKYSPAQLIAEDHLNASVLFADIVGFTPISADLKPAELVELLNSVFSYFDSLADKYGVEKIKTIGDCYMVAAGVPIEQPDHAQILTRLALEMRDYVSTHDFLGKRLSFRIGINSGALVAGVIGHRKFSYDLWGDAVNTASRMESHGQANVIQITRSTYELIQDSFACEPRGRIDVKGKGATEIWHVSEAKG